MDPWSLFGLLMSGMGLMVPLCIFGVFAAVIAAVGLVFYRNSRKSAAERQAAQSWPSTQGTILSSSLQWHHGPDNSSSQVAVVVYQYEVNGKSYQGQVIKAGERFLRVRRPGDNRAIVSRYPAGKSVSVYYDPSDPADAALER